MLEKEQRYRKFLKRCIVNNTKLLQNGDVIIPSDTAIAFRDALVMFDEIVLGREPYTCDDIVSLIAEVMKGKEK